MPYFRLTRVETITYELRTYAESQEEAERQASISSIRHFIEKGGELLASKTGSKIAGCEKDWDAETYRQAEACVADIAFVSSEARAAMIDRICQLLFDQAKKG